MVAFEPEILQEAPSNTATSADYSSYAGAKRTHMTRIDDVLPIRYAERGLASESETPSVTVPQIIARGVKTNPNVPIYRYEDLPVYDPKQPVPADADRETWETVTYSQFNGHVRDAGKAFIALGMDPLSAVCIWGFNMYPWVVSMIGAIVGGGVAAGIYPTDTPDQVKYKLEYTSCSVCVVENEAKRDAVLAIADQLPTLKAVVVYSPSAPIETTTTAGGVTVLEWKNLSAFTNKVEENTLEERIAAQKPESVCSLVFTSGTTGNPKAAMTTHDAYNFISHSVAQVCSSDAPGLFTGGEERSISYLPLSHVAGGMLDIIAPMTISSLTPGTYWCVHFARPYDLKTGTIVNRFNAVKPTLFFGVPRVWEKIAEKMKAKVAANPPGAILMSIAKWATGLSSYYRENCQLGGNGYKPWGYSIAKGLVLNKIANVLGLDECKYHLSAAAPLDKEVQRYFGARGINIHEAYGMTEVCGASTIALENAHVWGSVGFAVPGIEIKVLDSEGNECPRAENLDAPNDKAQGEICMRGRSMIAGYLANPALGAEHVALMEEKTAECIDENGWLHSGDMGVIDTRGIIKITGRYKELIIGAGGENIAPVPIETQIKIECDAISNIIMIGDKRKFNVCLITLKAVGANAEVPGTNELEAAVLPFVSAGVTTIEEACKDDTLIKNITNAIKATNNNGAVCPSNAAKIQKFSILPRDLSIESGELTPTMKTKRFTVMAKHNDLLDRIYESKDLYVPY